MSSKLKKDLNTRSAEDLQSEFSENNFSDNDLLEAARSYDVAQIGYLIEACGLIPKPTQKTRPLKGSQNEFQDAFRKNSQWSFEKMLSHTTELGYYKDVGFLLRCEGGFKEYQKTGKVPEELYPLFSQDGHWWGMGYELGVFGDLEQEVLSPEKLTKKDFQERLHLLSSFLYEGDAEIDIPYSYVQGDIQAFRSPAIIAPNLEICHGIFNASTSKNVYIPNLRQVGGTMAIGDMAGVIELKNLEAIGEDLVLWNNEYVKLASLKRIGKSLHLPKALRAELPKLVSVGQKFILGVNELLEIPELSRIGDHCDLQNLKALKAPKLSFIGSNLELRSLEKLSASKLFEVRGAMNIAQKILSAMSLGQIQKLYKHSRDAKTREKLQKELELRTVIDKVRGTEVIL